jgi:glucose/arabinose dehydrogenase
MEEVDLVEPGGNYGWPIREGTSCFNTQRWDQPFDSCASSGMTEPVIAYPHEDGLSAVIGGIVYHGGIIAGLDGGYIFGDWGRGKGRLFVARPRTFGWGLWNIREIQIHFSGNQHDLGQLLAIEQDTNGELYLLTKAAGLGATGNTGKIYRMIRTTQ